MTELGSCPPISQPLSPSALEALAACPFCFLAEKLWHYKEADEPEEELSALDKGGLWHTLLATFYREQLDAARKAGRLVACLDAGQKARYLARLRDIAKQLLADAPARVFVGPPGLWNLQREQIEAALEAWLNHELFLCSDKEKAFHPAEVEFSFGARSSHRVPPVNVPIVLPGEIGGHDSQFSPSGRPRMTELGSCPPISLTYVLPLEGRLDRLDLRLDDPDSAQPLVTAVRVLDYKLGRSANHKDDVKEEVLSALLAAQLPVYLKAAMEFVKALETQKRVRVDWGKVWQESQAAYYCLRDIPSRLRGKKPALLAILKWPGPDLRAFLSGDDTIAAGSLFDAVRTKVLEMLQGHFPVHPPECRSTSCAARFVCRYQAVPAESDTGEGGRKRGGS
ncbi:MAG: PD-(D/E)XK nuclease family protein [Planctomycetota bacterium]|nr:PD-(D/E)XK nuclease family protein [Planctomycetota bacterium]